jgi:hypothetical protein
MTKFKTDVKMDKMFQNFGNRYLGPFLRVYFLFEFVRFKIIKYKGQYQQAQGQTLKIKRILAISGYIGFGEPIL